MIGIFDSGVGGFTVLKALREALPSCDVVYFGDVKNAPYGGKPQEVGEGSTSFLISKESPRFRNLVKTLFPNTKYSLEVIQ